MDRIDTMRIFKRVADSKSFSKTANELALPRATVSLAVQQLEARLGLRLLSRTTRSVNLTSDGEALLARMRDVLNEFEMIENSHRGPQELSGTVRMDVPSRFARLVVVPQLADFLTMHPAVHIELRSSDRVVNLIEEGVDCAIRVGDLSDSSLIASPLGELSMVNCASPDYLRRMGTPPNNDALMSHEVVQFASPTTGKVTPWLHQQQGEVSSIMPPARVTVNNAETYVASALAGLGLVQVPMYDVMDDLKAGRLIEVLPDDRAPSMPVHAVYPHRRHLSPRLEAVLRWMKVLIEQLPVRA